MVTRRLPPARNVADAIEGSSSLAALLAGHQRSAACYRQVLPALPATLRTSVRPGPIDGGRWTLFAENSAVASKLRQLVPDLLAAAAVREPAITELRIKILPRLP
jgi:hypothetical protein